MFKTYILHSASKDRFYVGHTSDLKDRFKRHNSGKSKSTKHGVPWTIVYTKEFNTKSEAYQFEMLIKSKKSRDYIFRLIKDYEQ